MVNQKDLNCWPKVPDISMNSNNTAGPPPSRLPAVLKSLQSQRKMEKKLKKQNDENKENGGNDPVFFTQRSKTSNATLGKEILDFFVLQVLLCVFYFALPRHKAKCKVARWEYLYGGRLLWNRN